METAPSFALKPAPLAQLGSVIILHVAVHARDSMHIPAMLLSVWHAHLLSGNLAHRSNSEQTQMCRMARFKRQSTLSACSLASLCLPSTTEAQLCTLWSAGLATGCSHWRSLASQQAQSRASALQCGLTLFGLQPATLSTSLLGICTAVLATCVVHPAS